VPHNRRIFHLRSPQSYSHRARSSKHLHVHCSGVRSCRWVIFYHNYQLFGTCGYMPASQCRHILRHPKRRHEWPADLGGEKWYHLALYLFTVQLNTHSLTAFCCLLFPSENLILRLLKRMCDMWPRPSLKVRTITRNADRREAYGESSVCCAQVCFLWLLPFGI